VARELGDSSMAYWDSIPWWRIGIYLFLSTFVLGNVSTELRRRRGWPDGYSRKLNHVGIMVLAAPLLAWLPVEQLLPSVFIATAALTAIYAISAASKQPWLYGIVAGSLRSGDGPRRRFFFFMPLLAFNGALAVAVFIYSIDSVRTAFLTVAIADGLAEPVGLRFGRSNLYYVKDVVWGGYNTKSVAGSLTFFLWALIVALATLWTLNVSIAIALAIGLIYAAAATAIEAVSPRGLDNMLLVFLCPPVLLASQWALG